MPRIEVLTYNIWRGGKRGALLAEAVRAAPPDVVLVNESPKTPLLWRRRARRLAQAWGMHHVAGGRDAGSNMIAVAPGVEVRWTSAITLRQPVLRPRRGIAAAQLRVHGRLVGVVACHLSLDGKRRRREVESVVRVAGRLRGPVVVGGDLNEAAGGPSWRRLRQAGFVDHGSDLWSTFPADEPVKRIDALLLRGPATVVRHGAPELPDTLLAAASDHRPVLIVLDV